MGVIAGSGTQYAAVEPSAAKSMRWSDPSAGMPTRSVLSAVTPIYSVDDPSAEKPMYYFSLVLME